MWHVPGTMAATQRPTSVPGQTLRQCESIAPTNSHLLRQSPWFLDICQGTRASSLLIFYNFQILHPFDIDMEERGQLATVVYSLLQTSKPFQWVST